MNDAAFEPPRVTEDDLREAANDPDCPFSYSELWDMYFGPRGPSISEIIAQFEAANPPPDDPLTGRFRS